MARTLAQWRSYRDQCETALETIVTGRAASITIGDRTMTALDRHFLETEIGRATHEINGILAGGNPRFRRTVRMVDDDGSP